LKLQDALAPPESVALQVTVVVPNGKTDPEAGAQTTVTPGQLSATVELGNVTIAVVLPGLAATASGSGGHVITGGGLETVVMTLAVLLLGSGSGAPELTFAVLLITELLGNEHLTVAMTVTVAEALTASVG